MLVGCIIMCVYGWYCGCLRNFGEADRVHAEGQRFCSTHLVLSDMSFRTGGGVECAAAHAP